MPCVITKRQVWTCRLLLEMKVNLFSYFVTLTYSDIDLPPHGDLCKKDVQLFLKKLRKNTGIQLRYFCCGEYGDKKGRAHYHLLIFSDREFALRFAKTPKGKDFISDSDFHKAWFAGSRVDVVPIVDRKSQRNLCQYIAGYVLKKLGLNEDNEREPEFILSSRKPGLGEKYARIIARRLLKHGIALEGAYDDTSRYTDGVGFTTDLHMVKIDGKKYPLGRYLREKIFDELGGDNRPRWIKAFVQHQKALDRAGKEAELEEMADSSSYRASKAYRQYLRNRKL